MDEGLRNIFRELSQKLNFLKSTPKSLVWVFITFVFGLLQVLVIFVISKLVTEIDFNLGHIMEDGVFIFFSIAIVTSVTLDFLFEMDMNLNRIRGVVTLFGLIIPAVTYLLGMVLYLSSFITEIINKDLYQGLIIFLLVLTFLHAFVSKSFLYHSK